MRNVKRLGFVGGIVLPLVVALGCTGSNVLTPQRGDLVVRVTASPQVPDYSWVQMSLFQVAIRPLDPTQDDLLPGGNPLGVLASPTTASLTEAQGAELADLSLSSGRYRVASFRITDLALNRTATSPQQNACSQGQLESLRIPVVPTGSGNLAPAGPAEFGIPADGRGTLQITIDGQALLTLLNSKAPCVGDETPAVGPLQDVELLPLISFQ